MEAILEIWEAPIICASKITKETKFPKEAQTSRADEIELTELYNIHQQSGLCWWLEATWVSSKALD